MNLAAIRIRGEVRKSPGIVRTLIDLRLHHKNQCVILDDTPMNRGMLRKVNSFITWGLVSDELLSDLAKKRERTGGPNGKADRQKRAHFKLNSPKGGFGRNGIRKYIKMGGSCGFRGEKIDEIIRRMM